MQELNNESKLFFKNEFKNKPLPPKNSQAFLDMYNSEVDKCVNGVNINGFHVFGSLYYFLNHHYLDYDVMVNGQVKTLIQRPLLRDNDYILHKQYNECKKEGKGYIIGGARQISKELANYEPVITLEGEKPIGQVIVGDKIFGRDGKLTTISGVFPQGVKQIYRLTFSDGRFVDAGLEHQWYLRDEDNNFEVLTTAKLIESNKTYYLPDIKPVDFNKKFLDLSEPTLRKFKKIPDEYLYSSISQRKRIVEYLESRDNLTNILYQDLVYLLRSLGINCYFDEKNEEVIKLPKNSISIKSISFLTDYEATCITVTNSESLFLTKDFVPTHNTSFEVCLTMHELNFNLNSEVLALFASTPDQETFIKKLKIAINNNTSFLTIPSIDQDFTKSLIRFGFKGKDNKDVEISKLFTYLTVDGTKTEVGAGKTLSLVIMDEVAKSPFADVFEAIIPAIRSQIPGQEDLLKCVPILTFTGGDVKKVKDAKKMFNNPDAYLLKNLFIDGTYRSNLKKEIPMSEFMIQNGCTNVPEEFKDEKVLVRDEEKANDQLDKEEEIAMKESLSAYVKRKTYYPRKVEDMFQDGEANIFAHLAEELNKLQHYILNEAPQPKLLDFLPNGKSQESNKHYLKEIVGSGIKSWELDTPLVVYDEPKLITRGSLYVMGADVFNVDKVVDSPSLGSYYIMQKDSTDINNPFNSRIVACYNGRKDIKSFRRDMFHAMNYFGAETGNITLLHEAADDNLTQWFDEQNKGFYLADSYNLSKEINPDVKGYNNKGLKASQKNQKYYLELILNYLEEELDDGRLGLWRIPCPYLVNQLINYENNLSDRDAIVAWGHCLTLLHTTKKFGLVRINDQKLEEEPKKTNIVRSIFGNLIPRRKKSIF